MFAVILVAAVIGIFWIVVSANPPAAETGTEKGVSPEAAADQSTKPPERKKEPGKAADDGGGRSDDAPPPKPAPKAAAAPPAADAAMSAEVGELKVTIVAVTKPPARPAGQKSPAAGLLLVTVAVKNQSGTKKVDFPGWAPRGLARDATLLDNLANVYQPKPLGRAPVPGEEPPMPLYPDGVGHEVLAFEPPVPKIEFLMLKLPASILGGQGVLRFKIPAEKITERPASEAQPAGAATGDKPPKKPDRPRPAASSASRNRSPATAQPFGAAARPSS